MNKFVKNIALQVLTDDKARHAFFVTIISLGIIIFGFFYMILSYPWALFNGVFSEDKTEIHLWGDSAYDPNSPENPLVKKEIYREEYGKMREQYKNIIQDVFIQKQTENKETSKKNAEKFAEDFQKGPWPSSINGYPATHIWNVTTDGKAYPEAFSDKDADQIAVIACMFNNVGYEVFIEPNGRKDYDKNWYEYNHPEVLDLMEVSKDAETGKYEQSLRTVDKDKLLNLIKKKKYDFYLNHYAENAIEGAAPPTIYKPEDAAIYYLHEETQREIKEDKGHKEYDYAINPTTGRREIVGERWVENWVVVGIEVTHDLTAIGVGFIQYLGFEIIEDLLCIDDEQPLMQMDYQTLPLEQKIEYKRIVEAHQRINELYANHIELMGKEKPSVEHSKETMAAIINYEPQNDGLRFIKSWQKPVRNNGLYISAWFLDPNYPAEFGSHWGIDITGGTVYGKNVYPVKLAEVAKIRESAGGFGKNVVLYLGKDEDESKYFAINAHLSQISDSIKVGELVSPSTPIGQVGSTGNSTGPHLHFELQVVKKDGTHGSVDPLHYGFKQTWYPNGSTP